VEKIAASSCATNGASTAEVWTDRLAGIRQDVPQSAVAVHKDPAPEADLRQHEWCAPLGQQLVLRGFDAMTAGYA
jgi:hypothetical protein